MYLVIFIIFMLSQLSLTHLSYGQWDTGTHHPLQLRKTGGTYPSGVDDTYGLVVENFDGESAIVIFSDEDDSGYLNFGDQNHTIRGQVRYNHNLNQLSFRVDGNERVWLNSAGRLGLNKFDADYRLHATDGTTTSISGLSLTPTAMFEHSTSAAGIAINASSADRCNISFGDATDGDKGRIDYFNGTNKMRMTVAALPAMEFGTTGSVMTQSFFARNDAPANIVMSEFESSFTNSGVGSEDGKITISVMVAGSLTDIVEIDSVGMNLASGMSMRLNSSVYANPDYVFEDDYEYMSLIGLEGFIEDNKHLPTMSSTAEIEKNGVDIAKQMSNLQETVEIAYLYILELKEEIEDLKESKRGRKK